MKTQVETLAMEQLHAAPGAAKPPISAADAKRAQTTGTMRRIMIVLKRNTLQTLTYRSRTLSSMAGLAGFRRRK